MIRVLFVCMGNICRSPTAQGVFERIVHEAGWQDRVQADSAGTHAYHVGEQPDQRAQMEAAQRGIDLSAQRARAVSEADFVEFDYVLAMDSANLAILEARCPAAYRERVARLLDFAPDLGETDVPDPYYGGQHGFSRVLDLVEAGASGFFEHLRERHAGR